MKPGLLILLRAKYNAIRHDMNPHYQILVLTKKMDEGRSISEDVAKWRKSIDELKQFMPSSPEEVKFSRMAQKQFEKFLKLHSLEERSAFSNATYPCSDSTSI